MAKVRKDLLRRGFLGIYHPRIVQRRPLFFPNVVFIGIDPGFPEPPGRSGISTVIVLTAEWCAALILIPIYCSGINRELKYSSRD